MTEENTNIEEVAPENQGINISLEQILAAILHTSGSIVVTLADLVKDYSTLSVKVDQNPENQDLTFSLEKFEIEEAVNESEPASE